VLSDVASVNLGSLYENVVAQESVVHGHRLYYYDNRKVGDLVVFLAALPIIINYIARYALSYD
jgi:predicted AAA+ superfamily ATPase